jgi:small GTP-binding protein
MPLSRLITLVVGVCFVIGMMLWLISGLSKLYSEIAWTSPLLAGFLVFVLILLFICLIAAFIYYFWVIPQNKTSSKSKTRRFMAKLPGEKNEIAQTNLKAIKKQLAQIQDEVAQEALLAKSREIEANLATGALKVVVFGTGSAGKTSLVNALIGEIVGNVQASMGTTTEGTTYTLKLPGLTREILITDTPGILEMGAPGEIREQLARELATEADLLLFVCDNDLRASEFAPLQALASLGKRSLLVFNKIDLYSEEEQEIILVNLQERVSKFIAKTDVIKICANPQPVQFSAEEIIQPDAEIIPLIKRLAAVCRAEGDDLLADNILLQSQRLGQEARKLIDQQRRREADKIIMRYQWIGAGVIACTPLPVVDMLATAAVNAQMVVEIGQVYGCELNSDRGRDLALSLGKTLVSLGIVKGAVELIAKALQLNVATYVVGKVIQGVSAAYLTRIAGKSFVEYFRHDQDWGDGGITEVVQEQFKLSRKEEFIKSFVQDAITRVVEPIKENLALNFNENLPEEEQSNDIYFDDKYADYYEDAWGNNNQKNNDEW